MRVIPVDTSTATLLVTKPAEEELIQRNVASGLRRRVAPASCAAGRGTRRCGGAVA